MTIASHHDAPYGVLINSLKRGDELAMRELHTLYYQPLCYFAFTIVHNMQDAEDIAVDAFIKFWLHRATFKNLDAIKSYLFRTAKNSCLNLLREKKRRSADEKMLLYLMERSDDYVLNRMVNADLHREILQHIETLPKKPRRVLKEIFLHGKQAPELSRELRMPENTVHTNKSRGVRVLRELVVKYNILPAAASVAYLLMYVHLPNSWAL